MLSVRHKSAELGKAGHRENSATRRGPVSEFAMGRVTEPMVEAPVEDDCRRSRSGRHDRKIGGVANGLRGGQVEGASKMRQPVIASAVTAGRIPHGVELVPKASERTGTEPKNRTVAFSFERMIEATDDRDGVGRNPRSSPRTGKPFTWRRGIVGTACKQEVDGCPAR